MDDENVLAHGAVIVPKPSHLVSGSNVCTYAQRPLTAEEDAADSSSIKLVLYWGKVLDFGGNTVVQLWGSSRVVQPADLPALTVAGDDQLPGLLDRGNRKLLHEQAKAAWDAQDSLLNSLPLVDPSDIKKPAPPPPQLARSARVVVEDPMSPEEPASKKARYQEVAPDSPPCRLAKSWDVEAAKNKVRTDLANANDIFKRKVKAIVGKLAKDAQGTATQQVKIDEDVDEAVTQLSTSMGQACEDMAKPWTSPILKRVFCRNVEKIVESALQDQKDEAQGLADTLVKLWPENEGLEVALRVLEQELRRQCHIWGTTLKTNRNSEEFMRSSTYVAKAVTALTHGATQPRAIENAPGARQSMLRPPPPPRAQRPGSAPVSTPASGPFEDALRQLPRTECREFHRRSGCSFERRFGSCKLAHTSPPLCLDPRFK